MTLSPRALDIRRMFSTVAPRYDLLNRLLSLRVDRRWRRRAVREGLRPTDRRVLDLCCGTGDLAMAFGGAMAPGGKVVGLDFARPMLTLFRRKLERRDHAPRFALVEADSLVIPCADDLFDVVTVAFGLRNLDDTAAGIAEMARVTRRGGRLVILEFCPPAKPRLIHRLFQFYFHHISPRVGALISRHPTAYRYLPRSVEGFPPRERIVEMIHAAGLEPLVARDLTGGIATLFVAEKRTP